MARSRFLASATGREIRTVAAGVSVACETFDATGALLAACLDDGSVKVWRVSDGVELFHLPGNERGTNSIAFSPDGQLLAAASSDHITRVWSLASGRETAQLFHENVVRRVTFSADGSRILTAVQDGTARIWTRSGRPQHVLGGHDDRVNVAVFSPDDRRVLTASDNGRAFVWDAASGERLAALEGHSWAITNGQFSPDGRFVATASYDQSSRVWEAATGRLVAILDRDHGPDLRRHVQRRWRAHHHTGKRPRGPDMGHPGAASFSPRADDGVVRGVSCIALGAIRCRSGDGGALSGLARTPGRLRLSCSFGVLVEPC